MSDPTLAPPPAETPRLTLEERLESVERTLSLLSAELIQIRAELGRGTSAPGRPAPRRPAQLPPAAAPSPRPRRVPLKPDAPLDFEALLGRYGMLGIAVLTAVAAVGSFLSWAISRGYLQLGPAARVAIGLAAALGLGAWGIKLRRRERSFG